MTHLLLFNVLIIQAAFSTALSFRNHIFVNVVYQGVHFKNESSGSSETSLLLIELINIW